MFVGVECDISRTVPRASMKIGIRKLLAVVFCETVCDLKALHDNWYACVLYGLSDIDFQFQVVPLCVDDPSLLGGRCTRQRANKSKIESIDGSSVDEQAYIEYVSVRSEE